MKRRSANPWLPPVLAGIALSVELAASSPGENLPVGWRGDGTGRSVATGPVKAWNAASGEGIVWRAPMRSWANASPVVAGDRVMVTSEPNLVLALNARDGAALWTREVCLVDLLDPAAAARYAPAKAEKARLQARIDELSKTLDELRAAGGDGPNSQQKMTALQDQIGEARDKVKAIEKDLADVTGMRGLKWAKSVGYAGSTPVSDGSKLWVKFGTGAVACLDLADGRILWARKFDFDGTETGMTSPLLVDGRMVFTRVPDDPARVYRSEKTERSKIVAALDGQTGKTVWESAPLRNAGWGSGSPILVRIQQEPVIVTDGGDVLRATDGALLAAQIAMGGASTAVSHGDVVFLCDDKVVTAVRLAPAGPDKMTATRLWQTTVVEEKGNAFGIWSSPLIHEERLYLVDGQAKGLVLDLAGGQILGKFSPLAHARGKPVVYASLCLAAGRIFVGSEAKGVFSLVEPGPEPKVAAASEPLGDTLYSTPCFVAGRMYVRTHGAVFCIGFP